MRLIFVLTIASLCSLIAAAGYVLYDQTERLDRVHEALTSKSEQLEHALGQVDNLIRQRDALRERLEAERGWKKGYIDWYQRLQKANPPIWAPLPKEE